MRFIIPGRLDGLNEYTKANRAHAYKGDEMKRVNETIIIYAIRQARLQKVSSFPAALKITWYEPNAKRDVDNICFATKFIQDALVKEGIIPNDSQKYINKVEHEVSVDKNNPRIEVEILESKRGIERC